MPGTIYIQMVGHGVELMRLLQNLVKMFVWIVNKVKVLPLKLFT